MSLLTVLIIKNTHFFVWNLLYNSKNILDPTCKTFNTKIWPQWKDPESGYQVRQILESANLRALHASVTTCLACPRANVPYVLTCWRALRADVPTGLAYLRADVPTCLVWLRAAVSMCLGCFACSRANVHCVLCVPTCSRDITTNNKNKFSIASFPYFRYCSLPFSCEIKMLHILAFLLLGGNL